MRKPVRISLANKCQLLFGFAVILILTAALAVVWVRMQVLVREGQEETARKLANAWLSDMIQLGSETSDIDEILKKGWSDRDVTLVLVRKDDLDVAKKRDPFLAEAIDRFRIRNDRNEYSRDDVDEHHVEYLEYARAIRKSDMTRIAGEIQAPYVARIESPALTNPLEMVLLIRLRSDQTGRQAALNRIFVVAAGLLAGLLAIGVFWFITTRIILSPVRVLRDTAEKISEGDLNIRAEINTGDEFEQMSGMFNQMLEKLKGNTDQLQSINKSLDLKLGEMAATNVALFQANKIKGEFLANVSHELRTPMNSIVGFAELLQETLKDRTGPVDERRQRYIGNIITSSKRLLDLINDVLDLAKIEAGRMDLRIGPVIIGDMGEGLINLIRPQAEKRNITLKLNVAQNVPIVQTDAGKLQQVVFNFLSNAVKFTPPGGTVTLTAALTEQDSSDKLPKLIISVSDTGPGIAPENQKRIFDKFTQIEATMTREHEGTGLGLTISRELSQLLQGQIKLDSELGKGATFSIVIPLAPMPKATPLMPA